MARLTEQEKKNLATNMTSLNNQRKYTQNYVSKMTGIPLRTYETYLSGSYGASQKNLEKLAHFYQTTVYILTSENMGEAEMILSREMRKYQDSINERMLTDDEKIENIISQITPDIERIGTNLYKSFTAFLRNLGIIIEYRYEISNEELIKEAKYYLGFTNDKSNVFTKQYESKFTSTPNLSKKLSDEALKQIEALRHSYEYKNEEGDSYNIFTDNKIAKNVFLCKYYSDAYLDTLTIDLPISVQLRKKAKSGEWNVEEYYLDEFIELFKEIISSTYDILSPE